MKGERPRLTENQWELLHRIIGVCSRAEAALVPKNGIDEAGCLVRAGVLTLIQRTDDQWRVVPSPRGKAWIVQWRREQAELAAQAFSRA